MASGGVVQGQRSGPQPIGSTDNGDGTDSLKVSVSGVAEANLDAGDDEVAIYGELDGDGAVQVVNVDSAGRVRTDSNLQVADTDVANGNPVPISDASGSLTVDSTDLDVRDLTSASDSVEVLQDTASDLNAQVTGDVAHDDADSGNPVKVGAKALAHGASPTAVAANDRTDLYANRHGIPWVIGGHPNTQTIRANYTTAQTNAAIVTVGAGVKIVVTRVTATLDEATTVGVQFRIGFATATTPTTTGVVATHPGLVPGGGVSIGDGGGILGVGADNEDLRITSEVPTGGSLDVNVTYYEVPS